MRRAAHLCRRDVNEPELVKLARALGAQMERIHEPCDWLCGYRGLWTPVEVKTEDGTLTDGQEKFRERCVTYRTPFWVWRGESDVLRCLMARRSA